MHPQQHSTPTPTGGRRLISSGEFKRVMGGMSEMTRWRHEKAGIGPAPIKLNGRNLYFEDEVGNYLEELAASRPVSDQQSSGGVDRQRPVRLPRST